MQKSTKGKFVYFFFFTLAVLSLSWSINAVKKFIEAPTIFSWFIALLFPFILIVSIFFLGFFSYIKQKNEGKIVNKIKIYERMSGNKAK